MFQDSQFLTIDVDVPVPVPCVLLHGLIRPNVAVHVHLDLEVPPQGSHGDIGKFLQN